LTREPVQDIFKTGFSGYKFICGPFFSLFRISLLEIFVDERDTGYEIICSRHAQIDQVPAAPVDTEPIDQEIRRSVDLLV